MDERIDMTDLRHTVCDDKIGIIIIRIMFFKLTVFLAKQYLARHSH